MSHFVLSAPKKTWQHFTRVTLCIVITKEDLATFYTCHTLYCHHQRRPGNILHVSHFVLSALKKTWQHFTRVTLCIVITKEDLATFYTCHTLYCQHQRRSGNILHVSHFVLSALKKTWQHFTRVTLCIVSTKEDLATFYTCHTLYCHHQRRPGNILHVSHFVLSALKKTWQHFTRVTLCIVSTKEDLATFYTCHTLYCQH